METERQADAVEAVDAEVVEEVEIVACGEEEEEEEEGRGGLVGLVEEYGGGFYGVAGAVTFVFLEGKLLVEEWGGLWRGVFSARDLVGEVVEKWVFGIGVDSLMNGVWAMVWPAVWWRELELDALWLAGLLWLVCKVAREVVAAFWPAHSSLLREAAEEADATDDEASGAHAPDGGVASPAP